MGLFRKLLFSVLLAPAVLPLWGCTLDARGTSRPVTFNGGEVTVDGCLAPDQDGRLMLSIVKVSSATDDQESVDAGAAETGIRLSTSLDGPWVGTRVIELVSNPSASVNARLNPDRVLHVTGLIEPEAGTTGLVDQMKSRSGVRFIRLHVQSLQPGDGTCAVPATGGLESQ